MPVGFARSILGYSAPVSGGGGISLDPPVWTSSPTIAEYTRTSMGASPLPGRFGHDVDVSDDGLWVVGGAQQTSSYQGSVHIYNVDGNSWQNISNPNATSNEYFGASVSMSGDGYYLAVGAYGVNDGALSNKGAVYIYKRTGSTFSLETTISPPTEVTNASSFFGRYVDISYNGDHLLITSSQYDGVFYYTRSGSTWTKQVLIDGSAKTDSNASLGQFGYTARLSKTSSSTTTPSHMIIGGYATSYSGNNLTGAAHIYAGSGSSWSLQHEMYGSTNDFMGHSGLAINEDASIAYVGLPGYSGTGWGGNGRIQTLTRSGSTWSNSTVISPSDSAGMFGFGLDISNDATYIIASGYAYSSYKGRAYVYERSGSTYTLRHTANWSNATTYPAAFGRDVKISPTGNHAVIGAYNNSTLTGGGVQFLTAATS